MSNHPFITDPRSPGTRAVEDGNVSESNDLRTQIKQRDTRIAELEKGLEETVKALTHPEMGTYPYMEGSEIYADFDKAVAQARALLNTTS